MNLIMQLKALVRSDRIAVALLLACGATCVAAENIDPADDGSQYAWGENVGWLNAEPANCGDCGVQVNDLNLTGWMWGENIGWVNLSCQNLASCGIVDYGVENDACGLLTGFAWAENVGWINFAPATGGVTIDPQTGEFGGTAWGENIGWIAFADDSPVAYGVTTSWRRFPPTGVPQITLKKEATSLTMSWGADSDADGYDVFAGELFNLLASGGDFSQLTDCLAEDQTVTYYERALYSSTESEYYLVRAVNCGGNGTADTTGPGQVEGRDAEIAASGTCQ
jgi:hypothetical protein